MYQESIGFMAVTQLQSISYMIKHHDKYPLESSTDHALRGFLSAISTHLSLAT